MHTRRQFEMLASIFCLLLISSTPLDTQAADPDRPPNILLIVGDDQAWTDFGFMGHPVIKTPRIDQLAAESAVFPNGYVPTSLCRASLATILTGMYGHQHKICCNDPPDGIDRVAMHPFLQQAPSFPRILGKAGYQSLQTGKFWEGHFTNGGFTHGMTVKGRHGDDGLVIGRQTLKPIDDFLDEVKDNPFIVWYAPMLPHEPHNPPERFLSKYTAPDRPLALAKYYAMCEWFDETCGQVLDGLDRRGLRDQTLVLFVIDNGWIQETGGVRRTRGNFAPKSKLSPYDGGLRTPILIRWPGHTQAGKYQDLVSTIDIAPTLLAAAGQPIPKEMQGQSLLSVAAGQGHLKRDAVFGELYVHTALSLDQPSLNLTHRWVRQGDWKLILPQPKEGQPELYDVVHDPHEDQNVAAKHAERVQQLTGVLEQWWSVRTEK